MNHTEKQKNDKIGPSLHDQLQAEIRAREAKKQIEKLKPRTFEDITDILHSVKKEDVPDGRIDAYIKECLGDYSRIKANSTYITDVLKAANGLKHLVEEDSKLKGWTYPTQFAIVRNKILKIRETMLKSVRSNSYTVYRGVGYDAVVNMFENGGYKKLPKPKPKPESQKTQEIPAEIVKDINDGKPIIFDHSIIGTSLNRAVSEHMWHKMEALFIIELPANCPAIILDLEKVPSAPSEEAMLDPYLKS